MTIGSRKLVRIKPVPIYGKQQEFRESSAFLRGFVGGRGCVAPETRIGGVPIADIQGGARVSTLYGSQQSLPPFLKGRADLYRVRLRSGLEVVVTDGHRFLTPRGWIPLASLKRGSLIGIGAGSLEEYQQATGREWIAGDSMRAWDGIESIKWERKGEYWDLHVPVDNHYSAHGIWHHNTGKTRIGAIDVILRARNGESWLAVSPDSSVILETTWPTFVEVAKEVGTFIKGVKSPYPKATFHTLDGGVAEAVFRSGENPEKLRGPSKAGLWLDEASVMVEDVFLIGLAVLRHKGRMGKCSMTFTPKGRQHWTFHRFFEAVDEDKIRFHDQSRLVEYADQTYHRRHKSHLVHAKSSENPFLPEDYVDNIRANYSALFAQQELEGEFVDIQGLLFNRPDFRFIKERDIPRDAVRVRYWDRASTMGSGSYTAGVLMCKTLEHRPRFIIEDVVRGQWSPGERDRIIKETAEMDAHKYGNEVLIFVEQEGGSGGKEVADQMVMALAGFPVYRDVVGGSRYRTKDNLRLPGEAKVVRAMPLQSQVEINNVFIKEAHWNQDFLEEIVAFPESSHSDQVDATSGAFNKLNIKADIGPVSPSNRIEPQTNGIGTRLLELQRQRKRMK